MYKMELDINAGSYEMANESNEGFAPPTSCDKKLSNATKTKCKKTKVKPQSSWCETNNRTKRNRSEYENLDSSNPQQDSNIFLRSWQSKESLLKTNDDESVHLKSVSPCERYPPTSSSLRRTTPRLLCGTIPPTIIVADRERMRREHVWFVFFIFLYSMYLIIGGICFQTIEVPVERNSTARVRKIKKSFLQKYPQIEDNDLEDFLSAVVTANNRGISPLNNASNELNWSFGQALFFSTTVLTTIGYGNVTPLSQTGKIFCIIYASIGIPLTLVFLNAVVERLLIPANWFLGILNAKLGHLYQPFNIRLLHLSLIVLVIAVLFVAIPTAVFTYLEPQWGPLDAFYYCFITLTTVGLGDYIPGEGVSAQNRSLYMIFITGYLVLGLIAVMFGLSVFYDIPQLNLGQLFTENVNGETEKLRLSGNNTTCYSGPSGLYMPQRDEEVRRAVVRIRPHGDDSPSPDDPPSSLNRDIRIP